MREIEAFGIFQMVFKNRIVQTFQPDFSVILDLSTWIFFYAYSASQNHPTCFLLVNKEDLFQSLESLAFFRSVLQSA